MEINEGEGEIICVWCCLGLVFGVCGVVWVWVWGVEAREQTDERCICNLYAAIFIFCHAISIFDSRR